MRVIYTKRKECRKDRSARNTIGARYLPKNTVIRDAELEIKGTVFNKSVHIFAYADDIVIIGCTLGT
jgi:hypothetical protein